MSTCTKRMKRDDDHEAHAHDVTALDDANVPLVSMVQRVLLMEQAGDDEPYGLANISQCVALVGALASGKAKDEIEQYTGRGEAAWRTLQDPKRKSVVLLSARASETLNATAQGQDALATWAAMRAEVMPLAEEVEAQINPIVHEAIGVENMFKPGSLVKKGADPAEERLHAVAMECISVQHCTPLKGIKRGQFDSPKGPCDAIYAEDAKRTMPYLRVAGIGQQEGACRIVEVPSKPENGDARSVFFLLPDEPSSNLNVCIRAFARQVERDGGLRMENEKVFNFSFPCIDATLQVKPITKQLRNMGMVSMFENERSAEDAQSMRGPFEDALPTQQMESAVYVGNIYHGARIQVDHKGAKVEAVTATLCYRSLSADPPPEAFHCTRPFVVILAKGKGDKFNPEFALKVTGECLATEVDA